MCGHYFSITPKSSFGRLNGESTLAKAPAAPPPDHHTPTHARVDSIMGVSSSYSAHDRAAAVKEVDEKHRHLNNSHHNNGFHTPINSPSRKSSYNSLDQSTMGKAPMARKPSKYQLYPRPRLSECRRPPSSPLANVVVPEESKLEADGESGYGSATKDTQDEKSLRPVTDNSPDPGPKPTTDTTERKDFAHVPPSTNAPMALSSPHAVQASNKTSTVPTDCSIAHALTTMPQVFQSATPTKDVLSIKKWKGKYF